MRHLEHIFLPTTHMWNGQGFVSWTALLPRWTTPPEQLGQVELSNLSSKSLYLDRMTISISGLNMIVNQRVYQYHLFGKPQWEMYSIHHILYKHISSLHLNKHTYLSCYHVWYKSAPLQWDGYPDIYPSWLICILGINIKWILSRPLCSWGF